MEELQKIVLELKIKFQHAGILNKSVMIITTLVVFPIGLIYGIITLPIKFIFNKIFK